MHLNLVVGSARCVCKAWQDLLSRSDPSLLTQELSTCILKFQRSHGRRAVFLDEDIVSVTPALANAPEGMITGHSNDGNRGRTRSGEEKWAWHAANAVCILLQGDVDMLTIMCALQRGDQVCSRRVPTLNYSSFLANSLPVAQTFVALASMIPRFRKRLQELVKTRLDLTCGWNEELDLSHAARFLFALTVSIALMLEDDHDVNTGKMTLPAFLPKDKTMPLRVIYSVGGEYGVFMDPLLNTIHISSLDMSFLHEQFENSCRSLSRYNEICGVCRTLEEVEDNAKRLLHLRDIRRNEKLDVCQHAHCLFKLSLYWRELSDSLAGQTVEPSLEFKLIPDNNGECVIRLLWCASWQGRSHGTIVGMHNPRLQPIPQRWQVLSDDDDDEDDDFNEENNDNDDDDGIMEGEGQDTTHSPSHSVIPSSRRAS